MKAKPKDGLKRCSACHMDKDYDKFYRNAGANSTDGFHSWCKSCFEADKERRASKQEFNERMKRLREKHKK